MASRFDRQFQDSGFPQLLEAFGEPVIYRLRSGEEREFNAIITRSPNAFYDVAGNVVLPEFTIRFPSSETNGVLSSEVDTGGDTVELIPEIGGEVYVTKTVIKRLSQSGKVVSVALQ